MRTKEFLGKHGIDFLSRNVLEDKDAWDELKPFGIKTVPVVTRGKSWANGQILRDVADLVDIDLGDQTMLAPKELARRINLVLDAEQRLFGQMPEEKMQGEVPGRPRTFANLAWHTFNVVDAWLEHEVEGIALVNGAYARNAPEGGNSKADILAYGADVQRRFEHWWETQGQHTDFDEPAETYYGEQSKHDFLERTTWHSGQHCRQMAMILETFIGIAPNAPLPDSTWIGLPMPEKVWDDEKPIR
ncbi:MAG: DinB family protein [Hyphomicrobiaceae bacterium]